MLKKSITLLSVFLLLISGTFLIVPLSVHAASGLLLYSSYTGISVTPGKSISYSFEAINNTNEIQHVSFDVSGLNKDWKYQISSGG